MKPATRRAIRTILGEYLYGDYTEPEVYRLIARAVAPEVTRTAAKERSDGQTIVLGLLLDYMAAEED